jgi:uncharacterized membrane protein YkoI
MHRYSMNLIGTALFLSAGAGSGGLMAAAAKQPLQSEAKMSMATARAKALAARPGTIVKEELEREKGGSGLRYSFDIKSSGKTYEVGIDARDGQILENGAESGGKD